jgi:hypothetical protein
MKKQIVYAKFNSRLIANLVDTFVLGFLVVPISWVFNYFNKGSSSDALITEVAMEALEKNSQNWQDALNYIINDPRITETLINSGLIYKSLLLNLLILVISAVLMALCWRRFSSSPGKMIMGIKVVDAETFGPISTNQSLIRSFGCILSSLPLMLGMFWILFNAKKQSWHDIMANTVVIKR